MSIKEFNDEAKQLHTEYYKKLNDLYNARNEWIGKMWPMFKSGHFAIAEHELDQWECKDSPIGICIYNDKEDPIHDFCVFCDDPEERK